MGSWGVGMPAALYLDEFGSILWSVFGEQPFLVGSATKATNTRDVDVRVILSNEDWKKWFPGLLVTTCEGDWQRNAKWVGLTMAFSELGKRITGLPIDFQIQPERRAHISYPPQACPRHPIGRTPLRTIIERWK